MIESGCYKFYKKCFFSLSLLVAATAESSVGGGLNVVSARTFPFSEYIEKADISGSGEKIVVSKGNEVSIVDLDSFQVVSNVLQEGRVGNIEFSHDDRSVTVSYPDLSTVDFYDKRLNRIESYQFAGIHPNEFVYSKSLDKIFAADEEKSVVGSYDIRTGSVQKIPVSGRVNTLVDNGRGLVFAAIDGQPKVEVIDARADKSLGHFFMIGCDSTTGLDIDTKERRAFVACENGRLQVLDTDTGYRLNQLPIENGGGEVSLNFHPERLVDILTITKSGKLSFNQVKKVTFSHNGMSDMDVNNPLILIDRSSGSIYLASGNTLSLIGRK